MSKSHDLPEAKYNLCGDCEHFAAVDGAIQHLENGEQEFDHPPRPVNPGQTLAQWKLARPDLFEKYSDGKIGPNSRVHSQRGKVENPLA